MTKLYYNDPLASAYMAREFEIRFTDHHGEEIQPDGYATLEFVYPDRKPEDYLTGNHYMLDDFYIHPDSLDIFKAKVGDLLACDTKVWWAQYIEQIPTADKLKWVEYANFRVIQRNGKHFFTPREEI